MILSPVLPVCIITVPVLILDSPDNTTATFEIPLSLTCLVRASDHNLELEWIKVGEGALSNSSGVVLSQESVNAAHHFFTLELRAPVVSDTGTYRCHASNQAQSAGLSADNTGLEFYLFVQSKSTHRAVYKGRSLM